MLQQTNDIIDKGEKSMNEWKDVQVSHPSVGASVYVYSKSMGVIDGMLAHVDCRHLVMTWVVSGRLCYDVTHYHFKEYPDPPLLGQGE